MGLLVSRTGTHTKRFICKHRAVNSYLQLTSKLATDNSFLSLTMHLSDTFLLPTWAKQSLPGRYWLLLVYDRIPPNCVLDLLNRYICNIVSHLRQEQKFSFYLAVVTYRHLRWWIFTVCGTRTSATKMNYWQGFSEHTKPVLDNIGPFSFWRRFADDTNFP